MKNLAIFFLALALSVIMPLSASWAAGTTEQVQVEAEGAGVTKSEALKDAWMNAVRQAVGMYMSGKTETLDDKLTEEIVTHSRGQVNSFSILHEEKTADGWTIKINASIDKDIMQEVVADSSGSKTIEFNDNQMAKLATEHEKSKSKEDLAQALVQLLNFTDCVDYEANLGHENKKLIIVHKFGINKQKYSARINEIKKILEQIAIKKVKEEYSPRTSVEKRKDFFDRLRTFDIRKSNKEKLYDEHTFYS